MALAQVIASKLGVPALSLDAVMLQPTEDDLMRFKALVGVPLRVLQGREWRSVRSMPRGMQVSLRTSRRALQ